MKQKYQDNGGKSLIKIVSMNFDEERGAPRPDFADLWGERGGGRDISSSFRNTGSRGCWIVRRLESGEVIFYLFPFPFFFFVNKKFYEKLKIPFFLFNQLVLAIIRRNYILR